MKDYTSGSPSFSQTIKILEVGDPGHADNINVTTKQLLQNTLTNREEYETLKNKLTALTPVIMEKTLKAGETTVSFTVPGLRDTSRVEPISRQWGISPVSVYDEGETVTMAFDARTEDVIVGVEVRL